MYPCQGHVVRFTRRISAFAGMATLCVVLVAALPSVAAAADIRQIRVEGTERIEPATVLSYIDIQAGQPFESGLLDRALKNLFETGLFADVSFRQEDRDLVVTVVENPIVNEIAFEGNKEMKDEALMAEVQIRPRTVFTRTKVQADVTRLEELYRLSGRFSASVDPKIIKLDQNRVNLVFEISEGPETRIARIAFIGNSHFDDADLQKIIRSKEDRWYRFLTADDKYDPDRLAFDRELLRRFYLDNGYADFRVENAVAELSPDRKSFFVTFTLEEGERYRVGDVHIQNNLPDLDVEPLKSHLTFSPGEWYKASEIEKTIGKLTNELGNLQYAFVDVDPGVDRDREKHLVNITFSLNEGQKAFVESINISGNARTLDEVVRREMTLVEGDPFNAAKLKKSEQNIKDLGFFETVKVKPKEGSTPDKTDIDVEIEERSTGELSIGAGFSTSDGAVADFRVQERNFLGKGQNLLFSTTASGKRTEFDFSFTEPYFLKRDLSAGFDVFHITNNLQRQSSYDSKRSGGALRLGYPLSEHWRQNLTYRFERTKITDVAATASIYIQQQEGERDKSTVMQRLIYDTTDSRLEPTEGVSARFDTEVAGLGGDVKYFRVRGGGTYFYPVAEKWVLSLLGEAGYITGWGGEDVAINERFYLGGATLRGFADSGVGPRDTVTDDALGGNRFWRGSAELEFPSGMPEELGVRLHVFSDFGALSSLDDSGANIFDKSTVRVSAGGGVSWRSPMGPVKIDLAAPVVSESLDEEEAFRFSFGTRF